MAMKAASMSSWVYDVHKQAFETSHGQPIVCDGMTVTQLQQILHPQDSALLADLFSQLQNKKITQGQITVRVFNEQENQYRYYESRMRLSTEHRGKVQIVGTQLDVTEKMQMAKKTQDLIAKRELAMRVSDIVHWDFDVRTQKFESYNDPVNNYTSDQLVSITE